jgi:hypothetical protein
VHQHVAVPRDRSSFSRIASSKGVCRKPKTFSVSTPLKSSPAESASSWSAVNGGFALNSA